MAKNKSKPEVKDNKHGLTAEQFAQWELLEINLDLYKKQKGIKDKLEEPKPKKNKLFG